jgi:hypothetical protein
MFSIKSIEEIKKEIFADNREYMEIISIPESISFPFHEMYKEIVTKHKTLFISSECILYDFFEAENMTKKYFNYCNKNVGKNGIKNYWFMGENVGLDFWIMYINGKIGFLEQGYDKEKFDLDKIVDIDIDFEEWLKFAFLSRDFEELLDKYRNDDMDFKYYPGNIAMEYQEKVKGISKKLNETINSYWNAG